MVNHHVPGQTRTGEFGRSCPDGDVSFAGPHPELWYRRCWERYHHHSPPVCAERYPAQEVEMTAILDRDGDCYREEPGRYRTTGSECRACHGTIWRSIVAARD